MVSYSKVNYVKVLYVKAQYVKPHDVNTNHVNIAHDMLIFSRYDQNECIRFTHGKDIRLSDLPAFLRVLLMTDGVVTKTLESYFWEPIVVVKQAQSRVPLASPMAALSLAAGCEVLHREVRLCGEHTATRYVYAESYLNTDAMPESLRDEVISGSLGVGELLRERGLETYRELVDVYAEQGEDEVFIVRRYRIITSHQPFIVITEKFPLSVFQ